MDPNIRYAVIDPLRDDVPHIALCPSLKDAWLIMDSLAGFEYVSHFAYIIDTFTGEREE